jgi:RNA polymerase sigma factor (sigma-70 family)
MADGMATSALATHGARNIARDEELVAAVREGDDRAFETLYERYQERIARYVHGMVHDHARAEDITQDVFMAALRRMRASDQAIAFKPWIYEIAKNAAIDAFRRSSRTQVVSLDLEVGTARGRSRALAAPGPSPDGAIVAREQFTRLRGAFDGLSDTHHEILVMRELEGLSYREIGERLNMSGSSVESTLFRARRRLSEEYGDLLSGRRCRRIQTLIAVAVSNGLGTRETTRLSRHLTHCHICRREAARAGLDLRSLVREPARARLSGKLAGLLPFPWFSNRGTRRGGGSPDLGTTLAHAAASPGAEQVVSGWAKAIAAGAALVLAGAGTNAAVKAGDAQGPERPRAALVGQAGGGVSARRAAPAGVAPAGAGVPAAGERMAAGGRDRLAGAGALLAPVVERRGPAGDVTANLNFRLEEVAVQSPGPAGGVRLPVGVPAAGRGQPSGASQGSPSLRGVVPGTAESLPAPVGARGGRPGASPGSVLTAPADVPAAGSGPSIGAGGGGLPAVTAPGVTPVDVQPVSGARDVAPPELPRIVGERGAGASTPEVTGAAAPVTVPEDPVGSAPSVVRETVAPAGDAVGSVVGDAEAAAAGLTGSTAEGVPVPEVPAPSAGPVAGVVPRAAGTLDGAPGVDDGERSLGDAVARGGADGVVEQEVVGGAEDVAKVAPIPAALDATEVTEPNDAPQALATAPASTAVDTLAGQALTP